MKKRFFDLIQEARSDKFDLDKVPPGGIDIDGAHFIDLAILLPSITMNLKNKLITPLLQRDEIKQLMAEEPFKAVFFVFKYLSQSAALDESTERLFVDILLKKLDSFEQIVAFWQFNFWHWISSGHREKFLNQWLQLHLPECNLFTLIIIRNYFIKAKSIKGFNSFVTQLVKNDFSKHLTTKDYFLLNTNQDYSFEPLLTNETFRKKFLAGISTIRDILLYIAPNARLMNALVIDPTQPIFDLSDQMTVNEYCLLLNSEVPDGILKEIKISAEVKSEVVKLLKTNNAFIKVAKKKPATARRLLQDEALDWSSLENTEQEVQDYSKSTRLSHVIHLYNQNIRLFNEKVKKDILIDLDEDDYFSLEIGFLSGHFKARMLYNLFKYHPDILIECFERFSLETIVSLYSLKEADPDKYIKLTNLLEKNKIVALFKQKIQSIQQLATLHELIGDSLVPMELVANPRVAKDLIDPVDVNAFIYSALIDGSLLMQIYDTSYFEKIANKLDIHQLNTLLRACDFRVAQLDTGRTVVLTENDVLQELISKLSTSGCFPKLFSQDYNETLAFIRENQMLAQFIFSTQVLESFFEKWAIKDVLFLLQPLQKTRTIFNCFEDGNRLKQLIEAQAKTPDEILALARFYDGFTANLNFAEDLIQQVLGQINTRDDFLYYLENCENTMTAFLQPERRGYLGYIISSVDSYALFCQDQRTTVKYRLVAHYSEVFIASILDQNAAIEELQQIESTLLMAIGSDRLVDFICTHFSKDNALLFFNNRGYHFLLECFKYEQLRKFLLSRLNTQEFLLLCSTKYHIQDERNNSFFSYIQGHDALVKANHSLINLFISAQWDDVKKLLPNFEVVLQVTFADELIGHSILSDKKACLYYVEQANLDQLVSLAKSKPQVFNLLAFDQMSHVFKKLLEDMTTDSALFCFFDAGSNFYKFVENNSAIQELMAKKLSIHGFIQLIDCYPNLAKLFAAIPTLQESISTHATRDQLRQLTTKNLTIANILSINDKLHMQFSSLSDLNFGLSSVGNKLIEMIILASQSTDNILRYGNTRTEAIEDFFSLFTEKKKDRLIPDGFANLTTDKLKTLLNIYATATNEEDFLLKLKSNEWDLKSAESVLDKFTKRFVEVLENIYLAINKNDDLDKVNSALTEIFGSGLCLTSQDLTALKKYLVFLNPQQGPRIKKVATFELEKVFLKLAEGKEANLYFDWKLNEWMLKVDGHEVFISILLKEGNLTHIFLDDADYKKIIFNYREVFWGSDQTKLSKLSRIGKISEKDFKLVLNSIISNYTTHEYYNSSSTQKLYEVLNQFSSGRLVPEIGVTYGIGLLLHVMLLAVALAKHPKVSPDDIYVAKKIVRTERLQDAVVRTNRFGRVETKQVLSAREPGGDFALDMLQNRYYYFHNRPETQNIAAISRFNEEKEVIIPAGEQILYMPTSDYEKSHALIQNTPENDREGYLPALAMRVAYRDYLSNKYKDKSDLATINGIIIPRHNHGLAHTARVVYFLDNVIEYFSRYAQDEEFREFCQKITDTERNLMKTALIFSVVGRESEASWHDNKNTYERYRKASAKAFKKFISGLEDDTKMHMGITDYPESQFGMTTIPLFADLVLHLNNPTRFKKIFADPSRHFLEILLSFAHTLDLPRCYTKEEFDRSMRQYAGLIKVSDDQSHDLKELICFATQSIKQMGDNLLWELDEDTKALRIWNKSYEQPFDLYSTSIADCEQFKCHYQVRWAPAPEPAPSVKPT